MARSTGPARQGFGNVGRALIDPENHLMWNEDRYSAQARSTMAADGSGAYAAGPRGWLPDTKPTRLSSGGLMEDLIACSAGRSRKFCELTEQRRATQLSI